MVSVGSVGGSVLGSHRREIRVEILGAMELNVSEEEWGQRQQKDERIEEN